MTSKRRIFRLIALLLSASAACAQTDEIVVPAFTLESPVAWLEPHQDGLAVLQENGEVLYWDGELSPLGNGVVGDSLLSCGNALYGVAEGDALVKLEPNAAPLFGPKVMRYARPACLNEGLIVVGANNDLLHLDANLKVVAEVAANALPDAEIVQTDLTGDREPELIILSDPTERYAHAVLGDALEAASVSVFSAELGLLASYTLDAPFVFEQRRVLPFEFARAGETRQGLLATRSSDAVGAGVVLLALEEGRLEVIAEAQPIGTGFRWLNLFAAADGSAYAVRTPHIGGPLQRYSLMDDVLKIEPFDLGITNHVYGQRNLDLGVLLKAEGETQTLAVSLSSRDGVRIIDCSHRCEATQTLELSKGLSGNVARALIANQVHVAFADTSGGVYVQKVE